MLLIFVNMKNILELLRVKTSFRKLLEHLIINKRFKSQKTQFSELKRKLYSNLYVLDC